MRPGVGQLPDFVPRFGSHQGLQQAHALGPSPEVAQLRFQAAQEAHSLVPVRLQPFNEAPAGLRDELTQSRELRIPGTRLCRLDLQRCVPLPQRAGVPDPGINELRFHVEHRPVHPPPPSMSPFLHQLVYARINHLNRKSL